jgi:hypothetical protein
MTENLLGIPETRLQPDPAAALLDQGEDPRSVAAQHPSSSLVWAVLAEDALADGRTIEGYAFARTGYHRALDALRKSGWRGQGPVPWSHEPNRGFLRSLAALSRAAGAISETPEQRRCADFLRDSSREGAEALGL